MIIKVLYITLSILTSSSQCQAFTASTFHSIPRNQQQQQQQQRFSSLSAAVVGNSPSSYEMSSFARRMKNLIKKDTKAEQQLTIKGAPPNLIRLETLQEFKKVIGEEKEKLVVVRWFAPWCKACKAIAPAFYRLATMYPNVKFVDVPVTPENANLHQGLGVPSLPYSHIYHPTGKLVEELKISRKHFAFFAKTLKTYVDKKCDLEYDDNGVLITPKSPQSSNSDDNYEDGDK
jgi:thiol-disulfide isomerase/thioredoxin